MKNNIKKIIGVAVTVSLFFAVLHTAFAVDAIGISPNYVASTTTTTTTTITSTTNTATTLKAYLALGGTDTIITGTENVYINVNSDAQYIQSVKVGIRPEGLSVGTTLGQAVFDSVNNKWVFAWDSLAHTSNGIYTLFSLVTTGDGVATRSNEVNVTVKNETTIVNTITAPTTQTVSLTEPTSVVTAPTTTTSPALANLVKIKISLEGRDTTVTGTEKIYIQALPPVQAVYVQLKSDSSGSTYDIGPATFDSVNNRWVRSWDSVNTPDGPYVLLVKPTLLASTDALDGANMPLKVLVKNEDVVAMTTTANAVKEINDETQKSRNEATKVIATTLNQSAAQNGGTQPASEQRVLPRTGVMGTFSRPSKLTSAEIDKAVNENSQKLKDAIDEGSAEKVAKVEAEIMRIAQGTSAQADPESTRRVEEGIAKLKQVLTDQTHGVVDEATFKVESVKVAEVTTKPDGTQTASKIEFRGKALPNSFVTVYIFSIPIVVTVKADSEGNWNYTLDKELDNGNHQVYVGLTDVKGKVVVKSNPLPFVKTASAITVEEALAVPQVQAAAPSFVQNNYFYGIVTIIILVLISVFIFLGIKMSKTSE